MAGHRHDHVAPVLTETEVRGLLRLLIAVVAVTDIVSGGGYAAGAPATAPSLMLLDDLGGIRTWGAALAVAGIALFIRRVRLWGFLLGGIVCTVWMFFTVAVLFLGTATAWGWPPYLALAAAHVIGTWSDSKAAARRAH